MTATQRFSCLLLLPERTARVITEYVEAKAAEKLGDKVYDASPEGRERYYSEACGFARPEVLAPLLTKELGGAWTPGDLAALFTKVGFQTANA